MEFLVDGESVFAATGGRPFDSALPAAVLLHGAGMDHTVWSLQARALAWRRRAVLAVDLPGHGRSGGRPRRTVADLAAWVVALMDAAGVGEAALAGHSMGGQVALAATALAPGRVRRLALIGVGATMPVHPELLAAAAAGEKKAIDLICDWGHGDAARLGRHPVPGLWMTGAARRLLERARPGVLHADLAACTAYAGAVEAAARVRCPSLLVIGAGDRMVPVKASEVLAAAFAGARRIVIPGAGHMLMTEAPDAVTAALLDFV